MADLITPEKVYTPEEKWSDSYAKDVVLRDFRTAENYRNSSHDPRWQTAQLTYIAWVKKRNWEGTRIPRASIPVFLAFEQVESLAPRILSEIFADPKWFEAANMGSTPPDIAREVRDAMLYQGDQMRIKEQFRRSIKSGLIYGNGIVELSWLRYQDILHQYEQHYEPITKKIPHPLYGAIPVTVGQKRVTKKKEVKSEVNRPSVEYVSIFDFYIDPNCPSPLVSDARYACRRSFKYVDDLLAFKDQDGFSIPDKARLVEMAKNKATTQGDVTKGMAELGRAGLWIPQTDSSSDPAAGRVEVIAYYTKDRIVWVAGRDEVIYNVPNEMGFIPFYNTCYADVLDRFYAMAITDVTEGEQKLQEGIINARLDELSLSIHTPMAKKRGVAVSPYQLRRRPDQVLEVDDPSKDLVPSFPQNITQQAYVEVTASELRAQKATGVTDLAVLGAPSSGGNSANRTATGVNQQATAAAGRINALVGQTEYNFIEPLLGDWHRLNTLYLDPEQYTEILGPDSAIAKIPNINIMNAQMKFSMRASLRMKSKAALTQNFAQLMQTFLNPAFLDMLAKQQGKTINIDELANLLLDTVDYPAKKSIFRDLTPQEQQAMNQPPATEQTKMQMQQDRLQSAGDNMEMKMTGDLLKEVLKGSIAHGSKGESNVQ